MQDGAESLAASLPEVEHADLLSAQRFGAPGVNGQQVRLLRSLQRRYGNEHVARVLQLVRESPASAADREGRSDSSSLSVQLQAATTCPAPPKPPVSTPPDQDPKFQAVESKVRKQGSDLKKHPSPRSKVAEAPAAAVPPANDVESQAKAASTEKMSTAKPGTFDKAAFIAAVNKAIADASPKTLEQADEFGSSGKAGEVKNQVMDKVSKGKDDSAKDMKDKASEPPDPSKGTPKPVTPMAEEKPGPPPQDPGAAKAMPDPAPAEQTDLGAGKCETESKMAEAEVTEEHLKKSNEPQFQQAAEAKKAGEEHSVKAPGEVKAQENNQLQAAQQGASASTKTALSTMHGKKTSALGQVSGDKGSTKAKDETARAKVSADIEAMYAKTKTEVDGILNGLDAKVSDAFTKGEGEARKAFEESHKTEMQRWKDQRYSGWTGAAQWLIDKVKGLPPEANDIYRRARDLYLSKMNDTISKVADVVGAELTHAKERIAQGRDEIKKYVAGLGPELKKFGAEAEKAVASKFDDLDKDVEAKQESVVSDLAQKYVEARNKVDEDIKKMQEDNKGLWDKAKEAVGGAIEAVLKLKDLFLSVLAKAANAFTKILGDPIGFISNFMGALKQGFMNFAANILEHLKKGLLGWLFGALAEAGIELPETFDFMGILKMIASILGMTWGAIKAQIIKLAPWIAKAIDFIESKVEVFVILASKGVAGLWNWIKDKLGDLKDMIFTPIKEFVVEKIVKSGITWILGLLNPAGALIKIVQALISVVQWVMERGAALADFVGTVIDSVSDIAFGGIGGVPAKIEGALGKAVPLVISFFAGLLGLGGISEKIKSIFETVKKPVSAAIHAVVNAAIKVAKKLWAGLKGAFGKKRGETPGEGVDKRTPAEQDAAVSAAALDAEHLLEAEGATPESVRTQLPSIQSRHKLTSIELVKKGESEYQVDAKINPHRMTPAVPLTPGGPEAVALVGKLRASGVKPEDAPRIVKSLTTSDLGKEVAGYILNGQFDGKPNYTKLLAHIKSPSMIPAVRMAMSEAASLISAGVTHLAFEQENIPHTAPTYDMDLAIVGPGGTYSAAYQFKSVRGLENMASNATGGASQIINAPAKDKHIVLEVTAGKKTSGTKVEYDGSDYSKGIMAFKASYPAIHLRIEFADNQTLTL
jgi:hypothetical protein